MRLLSPGGSWAACQRRVTVSRTTRQLVNVTKLVQAQNTVRSTLMGVTKNVFQWLALLLLIHVVYSWTPSHVKHNIFDG